MQNKRIMIEPKTLKKGDKVSLIAPSGFVSPEKLAKAIQNIKKLGFRPVYSNTVLNKYGYLAGNDAERLEDLHRAFSRSDVKGIICIRGGYGAMRLLSEIDFELISRNPKFFMGLSDITALLQAITKKTGLITFHGSLASSDFNEYSEKSFLQFSTGKLAKIDISGKIDADGEKSEKQPFVINPGKSSGELWGGNLSLLVSLIGTPFDVDWSGKLIFIEEIAEPPYKIDRMLTQLILAGKLQQAAGIIFGIFTDCDVDSTDTLPENTFTLKQVIKDRMQNISAPAVYGFSFGHTENRAIFPVGAKAEFWAEEFKISIF